MSSGSEMHGACASSIDMDSSQLLLSSSPVCHGSAAAPAACGVLQCML